MSDMFRYSGAGSGIYLIFVYTQNEPQKAANQLTNLASLKKFTAKVLIKLASCICTRKVFVFNFLDIQ